MNPAANSDRGFKALLDVSRLVSRVGYGPHTGVDRVELAYLEWCLATSEDVYGLARVHGGYALLNRWGLSKIHDRLVGKANWGKKDLKGLISLKIPELRARAESDVRRQAVDFQRSPEFSNTELEDFVYLNIGHSNLSETSLGLFLLT